MKPPLRRSPTTLEAQAGHRAGSRLRDPQGPPGRGLVGDTPSIPVRFLGLPGAGARPVPSRRGRR